MKIELSNFKDEFYRGLWILSLFFFILCLPPRTQAFSIENQNHKPILAKAAGIRLPFIKNVGQVKNTDVLFYAETGGGHLFINDKGHLGYSFQRNENKNTSKQWVITERFVGASLFEIKAESKAITRVSYFKGKNPSQWKSSIPTYTTLTLGAVYPGVEIKLQANGRSVEKLFFIKPHADYHCIKGRITGADRLGINKKGELEFYSNLETIKFTKPIAYQEENGDRKYVEIEYETQGTEYGFKLGDYDRSKELIIDPLLASTFLGRSGRITSIARDGDGNIFVAGYTDWAAEFPTTPGAYKTDWDSWVSDVFVSKFDATLENLLASTFIGNVQNEKVSLVIDSVGNVYVAGTTQYDDFPTTSGAYDTVHNGYEDAFITKLDNSLQNLLLSTFLGGGSGYGYDQATAMAMDANGNIYLTGWTESQDFPTTEGAYDRECGTDGNCNHNQSGGYYEEDTFVAKLDGNLQNLLAATFLGGSKDEYGLAIAIGNKGDIFISGWTDSTNFPTSLNGYDRSYNGGDQDGFVARFDGNLENLLASTYLGSRELDEAASIVLNSLDDVYVAGMAGASNFPTTTGAYDTSFNGASRFRGDAFVSKLDANLQNLLASTFLGGGDEYGDGYGGGDAACCVDMDSEGNIFVAGRTRSSDFPVTPQAFDTTCGTDGHCDPSVIRTDPELISQSTVVFVSKFNMSLQSLQASTFFGGDPSYTQDYAHAVHADSMGNVYVAGTTGSPMFPSTPKAYDPVFNGYGGPYLSKFDNDLSAGQQDHDLPKFFPGITILLLQAK